MNGTERNNTAATLVNMDESAVLNINTSGEIMSYSPYTRILFHSNDRQLNKKNFFDFIHPNDKAIVQSVISTMKKNGNPSYFYVRMDHTKEEFFLIKAIPIVHTAKNFEIMLVVTAQHHMLTIRETTVHHRLNQLPTETELYQTMDDLINEQVPFQLIMLELNNTNYAYDIFESQVKDVLLLEMVKRVRSYADFVGNIYKLTDSKIAIIFRHDQLPNVKDMLLYVNLPIYYGEQEWEVQANLSGIAYPADGNATKSLVKDCTLALEIAKQKNHAVYFYKDIQDKAMIRKLIIERDLDKAIEQNQFLLHYQPINHVSSGTVVGFEALIRWDHPYLGMVYPGEFMPTLEESRKINQVGNYVFIEACNQLKTWHEKGNTQLSIHINLSVCQLMDKGLIKRMEKVLKETEVDPTKVVVEITESMIMQNNYFFNKMIVSIQDLGIKVSIDDFGTGFSSLSYLTKLQVDSIKLDKSFFTNIETNEKERTVVKSIIDLANSLQLEIVAEGIENEKQIAFLQKEKCELMQGYYFSKPVSAVDAEQFLVVGQYDKPWIGDVVK